MHCPRCQQENRPQATFCEACGTPLTAANPGGTPVRVHDKGRVRTIALNRPDKMNALTHALAWAIVTEVQKAAHGDDVWVIALTGQGKAFCAGLDLTGPGEDVSPLPPQERLMDDVSSAPGGVVYAW